jgi:hypothetical protein
LGKLGKKMTKFSDIYSNNIHSQNGEDGIIEELLKRIKRSSGVAVEFGAPTKEYCSNINNLEGWAKYWFDSGPEDESIVKMFITPYNVNELPKCNIISIDIDGNDFAVWQAYKGEPDIVIIEINSSLEPDVEFFHPDRGASFCTMNRLASDKGYFLLAHTGNCIYLLNKYKEIFEGFELDEMKLFNNSWQIA